MKFNRHFHVLVIALFAFAFFSGCSAKGSGYYPADYEAHTLNKKELDSLAWLCIYGEDSCLTVFKQNDFKTQKRVYACTEDEHVQWVGIKSIAILNVPNGKTDVDSCTVSIFHGENCHDIYVTGSFLMSSSQEDFTICDSLGSVFQTYRYSVSEKKGVDGVYFYCCAAGYENEHYQLTINGYEILENM